MRTICIIAIMVFWVFKLEGQKGTQFFEIRNYTTNMAISTKGAKNNNAKLYQIQNVDTEGQWELIQIGGYYRIRNKDSKQYIANFKQMGHGAEMKQTNGPGDGALWKRIKLENGFYQFQNKLSKLYLANGAVAQEGTPIYQVKNPGEGSYWKLTPVRENDIDLSKVKKILNLMEKPQTLKDVQEIMKVHAVNEKEVKVLIEELKKPLYSNQIEALQKEQEALQKKAELKLQEEYIAAHNLRQQKLDKTIDKQIQVRNQKASNLAKQHKANFNLADQIKMAQSLPQPDMNIIIQPPATASEARIDRVEPDQLLPGRTSRIYGNNFGTQRGHLVIWLNEQMYYADVNEWKNTYIDFDVPVSFMGILMGQVKEARLRVLLPGEVLGPYVDKPVIPNEEFLKPQVRDISSDVISPGQQITIIGDNFLNSNGENWLRSLTNASVYLDLEALCLLDHEKYAYKELAEDSRARRDQRPLPSGAEDYFQHQFPINIQQAGDRTNNMITGQVFANISGFKPGLAEIIIINQYGEETRHPIQFQPKMFAVTWEREFEIENDQGFGLGGWAPFPIPYRTEVVHPVETYYSEHREVFRSSSRSWYVNARLNDNAPMEWWFAPESFSIHNFKIQDESPVSSTEEMFGLDWTTYDIKNLQIRNNKIQYEVQMWAQPGGRFRARIIIEGEGPYCPETLTESGYNFMINHVCDNCPASSRSQWICIQKI